MTEVKTLSLSPFALQKLCNRSFLFYFEYTVNDVLILLTSCHPKLVEGSRLAMPKLCNSQSMSEKSARSEILSLCSE